MDNIPMPQTAVVETIYKSLSSAYMANEIDYAEYIRAKMYVETYMMGV